jgi:Spy/CpxP family protein refolding chaperone
MVRVRAVLGILAVVLLAGGWLWGQDTKTPSKGRLPLYWSKLGLSDEQRQKVLAIRGDYQAKIEPLRQKIAQLENEERAELAKILTAEQRKQLQKLIASKVVGGEAEDKKPDDKPAPDKKP